MNFNENIHTGFADKCFPNRISIAKISNYVFSTVKNSYTQKVLRLIFNIMKCLNCNDCNNK